LMARIEDGQTRLGTSLSHTLGISRFTPLQVGQIATAVAAVALIAKPRGVLICAALAYLIFYFKQ
jgi:hypothetical protein